MPVAEAGVGLERPRLDFIHHAALDIQNARAGRAFAAPFAGVNHVHLPAMPAQALVVVVRHQAAAPAAERNAAVFIVQVGLVLIDQILRPQELLIKYLTRNGYQHAHSAIDPRAGRQADRDLHLMGRRASSYDGSMIVPAYVIENGKVVKKDLDTTDPRAEQFLNTFLPTLYAHLKEKGWTGRYIQHVHDEPHDKERPIYNHYATLIRKNLSGILGPPIKPVQPRRNSGAPKRRVGTRQRRSLGWRDP
jgi:hypothetical protein